MNEFGGSRSELLAAILEETSDIVGTSDRYGRPLYLNAAGRRLFGLSADDDLSKLTIRDFHPEWAARIVLEEAWQCAWEHGVWRGETAFLAADGREVPVSQVIIAHRRNGSEPEYLSTIARDMSEQKRTENALLDANRQLISANELLAAIIRNAPAIAIQGYDANSRITFWNPASERLYGFSDAEAVGKRMGELVFTEKEAAEWEALARKSIESGQPMPLQQWLRRGKNGESRWVLSSSFPVPAPHEPDPSATRIVCMDVDISGRIEAEERLFASMEAQRRLEEQLVHAQKLESVGRLAGGVAHDFNNLLTVILGYVSLASEKVAHDRELAEAISQIRDAADRGASLVSQLLAFARRQIHQPRPVNLRELVGRLEQMLVRLIGEDVRLDTRTRDLVVSADPGQLEQVLVNLVVNARDAMPNGGVLTIETRLHQVTLEEPSRLVEVAPGDYAELIVADTGTGMSDEVRQRAFEPFFTTKPFGQGTGLGLATCYGIVRQHQGDIWVESEPERGTTFHILLPLTNAAPLPVGAEAGAPKLSRTTTVLVVEDELEVRNVTLRILARAGLHALGAATADEARQLMHEHHGKIELVVSDIVMPGTNGPDLVRELRKMVPGLRVLFVSGYATHVALENAALDERTALLQKPFSPDALLSALSKLMDAPALE